MRNGCSCDRSRDVDDRVLDRCLLDRWGGRALVTAERAEMQTEGFENASQFKFATAVRVESYLRVGE